MTVVLTHVATTVPVLITQLTSPVTVLMTGRVKRVTYVSTASLVLTINTHQIEIN